MGCMWLPSEMNGQIMFPEASKIIDYAIRNGVNFFDVSFIYHRGTVEHFIKLALTAKYPRESFYLSDKMPLWPIDNKDNLIAIFNAQLRRCGVEYFDIYLLHAIDAHTLNIAEQFGAFEFIRQLKEKKE